MWSTGESVTEALAERQGDRSCAANGFASAPKEARRSYERNPQLIDESSTLEGLSMIKLLVKLLVAYSLG